MHKQKSCAHAQWKKLWTAGGKKVLFYLLEYFNETYYIINYSIYCFCCSHPLKHHQLSAITCTPPAKIETWRVVIHIFVIHVKHHHKSHFEFCFPSPSCLTCFFISIATHALDISRYAFSFMLKLKFLSINKIVQHYFTFLY